MYAHLNHTMTTALQSARSEAYAATQRPARAAPILGSVRSATGRMLVRAGRRLAPETGLAHPAPGTSR